MKINFNTILIFLFLSACKTPTGLSCDKETEQLFKKNKKTILAKIDSVYNSSKEKMVKVVSFNCNDTLLQVKTQTDGMIFKIFYFDRNLDINNITNELKDLY